jgi:hypothetical protein
MADPFQFHELLSRSQVHVVVRERVRPHNAADDRDEPDDAFSCPSSCDKTCAADDRREQERR